MNGGQDERWAGMNGGQDERWAGMNGLDQVGSDPVGSDQVGSDQVGSDQVGSELAPPEPVRRSQWHNLALLAAAVAVPAVLFDAGVAVLVIAALLLTIMIHEAGHFLAARAFGMKATEFFLGFGPRLFSFRRGETEFGLKALPVGGYVKVIGMAMNEAVDPAEEHRTYRSKPTWQRIGMAAAGPATHFVIAFVLLVLAFGPIGERVAGTRVAEVAADSPALAGGLRTGDRIVALDGTAVRTFDDIPAVVGRSEGRLVNVTVERDGSRLDLGVRPRRSADGVVRMGVVPAAEARRLALPAATSAAWREVADLTDRTVDGLIAFFRPDRLADYANTVATANRVPQLSEEQNSQRVSSPVSMVRFGARFYEDGWFSFLWFLAVFNLGVGVFNLVPLPPFDGGHIVIALYEKVQSLRRGRRHYVDMHRVMPIAATVMIVLFTVFLSALYLDIVRPL
jgi:membrane-associated protease RseP (regulator of RpoE activity)